MSKTLYKIKQRVWLTQTNNGVENVNMPYGGFNADFVIYKGTDAVLEFFVRNLDRKPIPTKQLEAVREGLEDVAYMDILKKALAKAQKQNPNKNYDEYKKLLKEVPMEIMRDKSQSGIDKWRIQIANAIESLKQSEASTDKK